MGVGQHSRQRPLDQRWSSVAEPQQTAPLLLSLQMLPTSNFAPRTPTCMSARSRRRPSNSWLRCASSCCRSGSCNGPVPAPPASAARSTPVRRGTCMGGIQLSEVRGRHPRPMGQQAGCLKAKAPQKEQGGGGPQATEWAAATAGLPGCHRSWLRHRSSPPAASQRLQVSSFSTQPAMLAMCVSQAVDRRQYTMVKSRHVAGASNVAN